MLSPRKFAAGKKFLQRWQKAKKRQAKRGLRVESLEKRELMAADFHPSVLSALGTMRIPNQQTYQNVGNILENARTGGGGESYEGENNAPLTTGEVEPNNTRMQAQLLPLGNGPGQNAAVNVNGITSNLFDIDHYAFDLKKGDILDVRITTTGGLQPGLGLFNSQGRELLYSRGLFYPPAVGRPIPNQSPRFTTGNATLSYIIDTDGRYFLSVADANLAYSLNLRTYRPTIEQQPIGTKQILFLDFDGGFMRSDVLGLNVLSGQPARTVRVPAMSEILPSLNLRPEDEIPLARNIIARVEAKLRDRIGRVDGFNGFYSDTGNPGDFDIEIRNSYDHPDPWGQPNVSRQFVGGTNAQFGIPAAASVYGIAESIDFGNFNREETALTMLDISVGTSRTTPRAGNVTAADVFSQDVADTIVHEAGHILGVPHSSFTNNVYTIMDGFLFNTYGRDGLWGNADDEPVYFINDTFNLGETTDGGGVNNLPQQIAFGASTGKVGGSIVGVAYNDKNRNGRQEQNEEGIANWEVFADLNNNGVRDLSEPRTTSGANGAFSLLVAAGTYNVRINRAASWIASVDTETVKSVTVTTSGSSTANFGSVLPSNIATGFKWLDLNADGVRDVNEPGLAGVYIYLDLDGDDRPDIGEPASISGADGSFSLTPPRAGSFAIREVVEAGFRQTFPASGEHMVTYDGVNPLRGFNFGNAESADWGDAPAPYPTTRAQGGASHGATVGLRLGVEWDSDPDGQPSQNADADDTVGLIGTNGVIDDEDGVAPLTPFVRADSANALRFNVTNTTGSPAYIQGWMDFNGDGDWADAGEQIVSNLLVSSSGVVSPSFTIPSGAVSRSFARFRLSQAQNLGPAGRTATGEVEDYVFNIGDGPRTLLQNDTVSVARNSRSNVIDVLANDFALPGEPWTIVGVSAGIRGGRVTIDTATNRVNYVPPLSFIGTDEFTYTVRNASGRTETAKVTVSVLAQFLNPVGVDDSFEVTTNSSGFPLNVLANDIEGRGGALVITGVQYSGTGSVTIGSGGLSIRYTPAPNFGGTEFFQYTATDALGESTTANVTVHTIPGAFADDLAAFSFRFFNMAGQQITEIRQGEQFRVSVFVDDLRPEIEGAKTPPGNVVNPGVFSAYLDMLYNSGLVAPASPVASNGFDFQVAFASPYLNGQGGSAGIPGIIDELGAFVNSSAPMDSPDPLKVADLVFNANNAGLAEFVGDPADRVPASDVTFYNEPRSTVSKSRISYGRSRIEIVPNTVNFPFAVDDSPARLTAGTPSTIDVLRNDIVGSSAPIQIVQVRDPASGQVSIDRNGTPSNFADDRITYTPRTDFTGTDQFQYVIQDARGFQSTATVTVQVGTQSEVQGDDKLHLRLSVTNLAGEEITQITRGSEFQLRGFVRDLRLGDTTRPNVDGVFAAFQDVLYSSGLVTVKSTASAPFFQVSYSPEYGSGRSGDVRIPGLINEIGSFQSSSNPFPLDEQLSEKLQFVVTLVANPSALLNSIAEFIGNPADISPFHDTLMFDPTSPVPISQIRYINDSVTIVGATGSGGGTGSGEGFTNLRNAYDVDNDGFVSAIDVLILVNSLNSGNGGLLAGDSGPGASGESSEKYYFDVDADGMLSALDVLGVVNFLNNPTVPSSGAEGEGEGEAAPLFVSNSQNAVLVDTPFAKLDSIDSVIDSMYIPMMSAEGEEDEEWSLADYFSSVDESGEDDLFSGLADDILRNG